MRRVIAVAISASLLLFFVPVGNSLAVTQENNRNSTCKQIQEIYAGVYIYSDTERKALDIALAFSNRGETAKAKQWLKKADNARKNVRKELAKGERVAKNPQMKDQFRRWNNALKLNLPTVGSVAKKATNKIFDLLADGKC